MLKRIGSDSNLEVRKRRCASLAPVPCKSNKSSAVGFETDSMQTGAGMLPFEQNGAKEAKAQASASTRIGLLNDLLPAASAEKLYRVNFPGNPCERDAVSVRGSDGLLQFATLIGRVSSGLLVQFKYSTEEVRLMQPGAVFWVRWWERHEIPKVSSRVAALVRLNRTEPWKWFPGVLLFAHKDGDRIDPLWVRINVPDGSTVVAMLRRAQVRCPSDDRRLSFLLVNIGEVYPVIAHHQFPYDGIVNINTLLPSHILGEIFRCVKPTDLPKVSQVCMLWRIIIVRSGNEVICLKNQRDQARMLWTVYNMWSSKTKLVIFGGTLDDDFLVLLSRFMARFIAEYGYSRLNALVLCGDLMRYPGWKCTHPSRLAVDVSDLQVTLAAVFQRVVFRGRSSCIYRTSRDTITGACEIRANPFIQQGLINLDSEDLAVKFWDLVDENDVVTWAVRVGRHYSNHNEKCSCAESVLDILDDWQSSDPRSVAVYREKRWLEKDLILLDPMKLTRLALFKLWYYLERHHADDGIEKD